MIPSTASIAAIAFVVVIVGLACRVTAVSRSAPYVPTPMPVVRRMLEIAEVGPGDVLFDLGSGDGRIVIAALRDRGAASAVGIDIDPRRIRESRRHALAAGMGGSVSFVAGDFFRQDFSTATVVSVFMLPEVIERLVPLIRDGLAPGTRIVMHQFPMAGWRPDRQCREGRHDVFMWVVPARVAGRWRWQSDGASGQLNLMQRDQDVSGSLTMVGRTLPVIGARVTGARLEFSVEMADGGLSRFSGGISGKRIVGTLGPRNVVMEWIGSGLGVENGAGPRRDVGEAVASVKAAP